jgi:hypothetical protein
MMAAFISNVKVSGEGGGDPEKFRDFFGPAQIDQSIRMAVQFCWMQLPKSRRNHDELEKQIRRIVDRALRDFREDQQAFMDDAP